MLTHALLAGGRGTRLFGEAGGLKALVEIGPVRLVDYSILEVKTVRPTALKLVVPQGDQLVRAHAASLVPYPVIALELAPSGTGPAVKALLEACPTGCVVLTTCDLAGPNGALASFVGNALELVTRAGASPMCAVAVSRIQPGETQPVYTDVRNGRVVGFGKGIAPTDWVYSGARVMNESFAQMSVGLSDPELSDTQMVAELLKYAPTSVVAITADEIFDVDDAAALAQAIRLERKVVPGLSGD